MPNTINPDSINPEALKYYRIKKGYKTQEKLADKLECKKDQVNRWENGRTKKPRKRLLEKLTAALGVTWDDLTRPPPARNKMELNPTVQLGYRVSPDTRTALELVSRMFGVLPAAIIEIAPLLFLITAHKSLEDRKKKIDLVNEQLDQILEYSKSAVPHLAPAYYDIRAGYAEEAIGYELESIEKRELFGPSKFYAPWGEFGEEDEEKSNPFGNYIENLLDELPDGWIEKEEFYSPDQDVPEFRISMEILRQVVGISGDTEKVKEILRCISNGDIDLRELLQEKERLTEQDYLDGLVKKYETAESKRKARFDQLFTGLNIGKEGKS